MKRVGLVLFIGFFIAMLTFAGKSEPIVNIEFDKEIHDFGRINESDGNANCEFLFTNTGNAPLLLYGVRASCGCTTPEFTREPVLPGHKGRIKVAYSTKGRPGSFYKSVTVYTNIPDTSFVLTIKGNVIGAQINE